MSNPTFSLKRTQLLGIAIACVFQAIASSAVAGPEGGQVVAGQGAIEQIEKETRIQQASDRLSIDWKSFDVNSDERVQFIQPNSSSIAFNRILSNKGSLIQGKIDANGQVVLINPNGLIFTEGASVNAGGLIASALQMNDQDYLNGKFTLNALEGSEGRVVNSGLLNASTGGSISLLGQSVDNKGLISAQLGSVNLAAGKEAVLTFEPNGFIGVRVTEAVLQKDLGVDAAIINGGEIMAEGGKVLITATTSKDIFSKAVNVGELSAAKSAVVNVDGSFTLGSGADVVNTGRISVNSENASGGEAVIIGDSVTNSGQITADGRTLGGHIELNSADKTHMAREGKLTANASRGKGGDIKLLGDKVGIFDHAIVDASGSQGGGQVLLGGDETGANRSINNARFLYLGKDSIARADGDSEGDGGKIIVFSEDTSRIYGFLSAAGGELYGKGGFVETSGKVGLEIDKSPDVSSTTGPGGKWLIDPYNIEIVNSASLNNDFVERVGLATATNIIYSSKDSSAQIGWNIITQGLDNGSGGTVEIKTTPVIDGGSGGTIKISADFNFNAAGAPAGFDSKLILNADKKIEISKANTTLQASNNNRLSIEFLSKEDIDLNNATIITNGGDIKIGTAQAPIGGAVSAANATLNTSAANGAGDITIDSIGDITIGNLNLSRTNLDNQTTVKFGTLTVTSQGSIGFEKDINFNNFSAYNGANSSNENWTLPNNTPEADKKTTFTLNAAGDINFKGNIFDSYGDGRDGLNIVANADAEVMTGGKDGTGSVIVGNTVYTSGGNVQLTGAGIQFGTSALIDTDRANSSPDNAVTGNGGHGNATRSEGGNVTLSSDSNIVLGSITTDHFCTLGTCTGDLTIQNRSLDKSISITQSAGKALSVHGTTTLKTNGGAITLGEAGNIFGTTGANAGTNSNANNIDTLVNNAKVATGRTIAITNAGNSTIKGDNSFLTLGNVSAQGLSLSTTKDIRQVAGTSIDVNTAAFKGTSVLLINSGNKLGTVTSLETTATSAGTASINTIQDITLSALNIASGQLGLSMADGKSATFDGAITANSAFTVTASGANTTANLADSLSKTGGSTVTFAGFNTLHYTGANEASWNLTSAAQTVSWSGKTFKFDTATSLVGGSGVDKFLLSGTPYSLPTLDGADGDDELTVNAVSATANKTWSVELDSASAAAEGKIRATNIKSLAVTNVPANVTVQLGIGNGKDTTWNLTGATTTYTLNNADLGEVEFTGFNQVAGGDGKDVFDFSNGGSQIFAGKVDGAGGAEDAIKGFNADAAWDLTSTTANFYKTADSGKKYNFSGVEKLIGGTAKDSVTLASTVTEVSLDAFSTGFSLENFEGITATAAGGAKLTGYSGDSTWEISKTNEGKITSNGKSTEFAGFNELIGAQNNKDEFSVTANGSVTSITGQAEDILNVRSSTTKTNNWAIAADGTAEVKEGSTTYINKISRVGTVNASAGADNFTAAGTYGGTIKAAQGNAAEDVNTLVTAKAVVVFADTISANGIEGITKFNAAGTTAEFKASSSAGAVNWAITPGAGTGQLSGVVTDATSGKNLAFSDFATLVGGDNDDNFTLGAGAFSGGALQGGNGKNTLINTVTTGAWDLSTTQLRTVLFAGMQTLRGLSGDSVKAPNATNAFTLDATSTRLASTDTNNKVTNYTLENFTTLIGGDNQDTFKVDVDAAGVELQGGKGNDTFTLANETIKTKHMVGGEGSDTVKVTQGTNGWILSAANTGSVNANSFSTVEILAGGSGVDTFDNKIAGQTLSLSAIDGGALHATSDVDAVVIRLSGMNSVNNLGELKGFSGTTAWTLNSDGAGTVKTATNASLSFTGVTNIIGGSGNETFTVGKDVTTFDINGGLGINTLQGAELANKWQLTDQVAGGVNQPVANTGTLNSTGLFTAIQTLKGGSLADSLDLTGSTGLTVTLANIAGFESLIGGTNSSLTANNQTNAWQLNAGTKGLINSIAFENFAKLYGGTALDTFAIANGSQFKGEINGGVNTSSSVRDEVKIDSVAGKFAVTAQGVGTLDYINTTNSTATNVKFNEVETLTGGSAADTFAIGADVDMVLDGGTGVAVDVINLPQLDLDISLAVGSGVPGVNNLTLANFENIAADATTNSTLRAVDGEATWAITDKNTGSLTLTKNAQTSVTEFSNFNKLVSGSGVDHFIFGDTGSIKTIEANDGDDLLGRSAATRWDLTTTLQLTDLSTNTVYAETISNLKKWQGGAGADNFNLSAATASLNNLAINGGEGQNQLTSPSGSWVWALTGSQQGSLALSGQTISFAKVNTLIAGASQTLNNTASVDAWKINQADQLTAVMGLESTNLNKFNLVNTGAGDDVLDINKAYSGSINMQGGANTVTLGAAGTIVGLSAGSGTDKIKSAYASSLWTQTEENNKRFIKVAQGNTSLIGELTGFESIEVAGAHTLATTLTDNSWAIADSVSGTLNGIGFSGFKALLGSDENDTFSFANGVAFGGTIDGGKGNNLVDVSTGSQTKYELNEAQGSEINGVKNATGVKGAGNLAQLTLVSPNKAAWSITGDNKGELTYAADNKKFSFEGFGVLVGGAGNDTFEFSAPTAKINRIEGGAQAQGGVDTVVAKTNQANLWTIGAGTSLDNSLASANGTAYLNDYDGIEEITGAGQDKLVIAAGSTQWDLNKTSGALINTPTATGASTVAVSFSGINTLWGSDGKDTYNLIEVPEFADIDGRGGDNLVQLANQNATLDLSQGFAVQGVKNVTGVSGKGTEAKLTLVTNSNATWTLTEKNTGSIKVTIGNQEKSIAFDNFIDLIGGANNDAFILGEKGFVTGTISGGTNIGEQNSLTAWSGDNATWSLDTTSSVAGATNGLTQKFSGITLLNGSDKNDRFNVQSVQTLTINGGLGNDLLRLGTNGRLIGQFIGGDDINTVQTADGLNTWQLTSATGGSVLVTGETTSRAGFSQVSNLIGGSGGDTLIGLNTAATWDVTATTGVISTGVQGADKTNFSNMDILTGGSNSDLFKVSGAFAGNIIAGAGSDTLELLAGGSVKSFTGGSQGADATGDKIIGPVAGAIWQVNATTNLITTAAGAEIVGNFQEVETLQADSAGDDTFASTLEDNSWTLATANSGEFNGGLLNGAIKFSGFDYLKGSVLKDTFIFNFVGTFGKGVDAGIGENTVQLNLVNRVEFDWSDKNVNGVKGANRIIGSNSADSELSLVSGKDLAWTIDRVNGGDITDGGDSFKFDQFKNLKGSAKADTLRFTNAGAISGSIDGGEGTAVDTLQGLDQENNWQLGQTLNVTRSGASSAYVNNATGFERLFGGTGVDVFTVTGKVKAAITGREGNDKLILSSTGALDGSFTGNQGENSVESQLASSTWNLTSASDVQSISAGSIKNGDETALSFSGVQQFSALPAGDNELNFSAINFGLKWTIDGGANQRASGQVELSSDAASRARFSGFNRITGAAATDEFSLSAAIGELNLGAGNNRLSLLAGGSASRLVAGTGSDELKSYAGANRWQMISASEAKLSTATGTAIGQIIGFEVLTGTGTDTLTGAEGTNRWEVTSAGRGTLNAQTAFDGFANLVGNTGADTFAFGLAGTVAQVTGGEGTDSLVARTSENRWNFSANDRGTINSLGAENYVSFSGVEQFTGATLANDRITLAPEVTQVQLKAGGQAGDELFVNYRDSLNLSSDGSSWLGVTGVKKVTAQALTAARNAQLTSTTSLASRWTINEENGGDWTVGVGTAGVQTTHFSGFDKLQGSTAADAFILSSGRIGTLIDGGAAQPGAVQIDSLAADNKSTYWTVRGTGAGSLTYLDPGNPLVQQFVGIETLIGNDSNDAFRLEADGISINIRGGNSTGVDTVAFNGALDITLGQQDVVGVGIAEIEVFTADPSKQNTLRSSATGGTWTLSGTNAGVLQSGSESLTFSNFQKLLGGKGEDVFTLDETARVTGLLSGGVEGDNTLRLSHDANLTANLSADGAGDITGTAAIARFEQINTLEVAALAPDLSATLTAANQPNQWVVSDNKVELNGFDYSGFTQLNGQDGVDNFVLNGKQTLSIDGKNGSDSLTLNSAQGAAVSWQLNGATGSVTAGGTGNPEVIAPLFANMEQLFGGDGNDAFALNGTGNRYSQVDGSAGDNSLASTAADGQWQLGALTSDGSPVVDQLNNTKLVNIQTLKGSGSDSLLGSDDDNLWLVGRGGSAALSQSNGTDKRSIEASGMARIKGGKGQDDFVLQETGTGSFARLDGGEVGADSVTGVNTSSVRDSLDATALTGDVQVNLNEVAASANLAANQLVVAGFESIKLNSATNNTLYGPTLANRQAIGWQINQSKQGSFAPKQGAHGENTVTFSGVSNLIAGAGEDRFALATADGLGGDLDGGDGTDYLDYSQAILGANQSSFDVVIGDSTRLKNIEGVIGKNTSTMRLVVKGASSQWVVDDIDGDATTSDGVNDGRVTLANGKSVDFVDFAALVGTQGVDEFRINGGFNGSITTGEGADALLVGVNPARAQSIKLNNDSSDSLSLSWQGTAPAGVKETYKQAVSGRESISLESLSPALSLQPFVIEFNALAAINDRLAVDEMRVQTAFESAGFNRLSLTNNALQLSIDSSASASSGATKPGEAKIGTWFNVENKTNLVLSGQTGDQLSLSGNSQLPGILSIEKFTISAQGEQNLGAGQINFNGVGGIGTEQKAVAIATPVVQFNNLRGDAWVISSGDIKLASLDGQGKLNLRADGLIGQTQALSFTRDLTLAASGPITLDNADNRLTGGLSLNSSNAINLANGLTSITGLTAEQFTYNGQDLSVSGPMVVAGTTALTSTGSIEALNAANRIARLQVNAGGSANLALGLDATLIGAKVGSALQVQANGLEVAGDLAAASIDLNAGVPATGAGQLKVNGQLSAPQIALTAGDIVLNTQVQGTDLSLTAKSVSLEKTVDLLGGFTATADSLQQAAAAAITTKGAFTLAASGAVQLDGAITSGRDIAITTSGNLVQSGVWKTEGVASGGDTKAASVDVVVKSGGSITQQTTASTQSAGNINYEAGGTIKLTSLSAKGEVMVNATTGIEDVNGTATNITGSAARLISGGNINGLDLSVDSLIGQFAGNAKTVSLRNDKTLRIDRLVTNASEAGAVTTISVSKGDVIFNNDASKNPEAANLVGVAQEKTGIVNGNFASGTLNVVSEKGRVRATGAVNLTQPDLVANNINIFSALGVSTPSRPLVIYSGGTVLFTGTGLNWKPRGAFGQLFGFSSDNALDISQLLLAAGDQLIEVEPLEDVNPAVFTDVRNYSADNLSIMLPADQRYEE